MTRPFRTGYILLCAALALSLAGCLAPGTGVAKEAKPIHLYSRGDLLAGNMTLAGYDTPDPRSDSVGAVVLAFQPETDTYVYTFVRTFPNGSISYVFIGGWEARLARNRPVFESYGFEKVGTVPEELLWKV